jgi:hypothetical protein
MTAVRLGFWPPSLRGSSGLAAVVHCLGPPPVAANSPLPFPGYHLDFPRRFAPSSSPSTPGAATSTRSAGSAAVPLRTLRAWVRLSLWRWRSKQNLPFSSPAFPRLVRVEECHLIIVTDIQLHQGRLTHLIYKEISIDQSLWEVPDANYSHAIYSKSPQGHCHPQSV